MLRLNRVAYQESRVVYAMLHGCDPAEFQVDHRRHDKRNDALRLLSPADNIRHRVNLNRNNTSGFKGVCWHKNAGRWMASIRFDRENVYLGLFDTVAAAVEARRAAEAFFYAL